MRVQVDWELCIGSGLCVAATRGAFQIVPGRHGGRAVLVDGSVNADDLWRAATGCPTLAILLTGDDGGPIYPPTPATAMEAAPSRRDSSR